MSLNLALRFIVDALKKPPSSKMYLFGLAALDKCKKRLKDFPQFCASIASISHFQSFPSQLKQVSIMIMMMIIIIMIIIIIIVLMNNILFYSLIVCPVWSAVNGSSTFCDRHLIITRL